MKIDKNKPTHWLCLILLGLNVMGAVGIRLFRKRKRKRQVVLYGHKLNGNLLAIHDHLRKYATAEFEVAFLTMDKAYHRQLCGEGVNSVLATRPGAMKLLACTDAVISDHGLHSMQLLVGRTGIRFFDVWHGIPFKGFDADDFRLQHRFDETWVASELNRELYIRQFGFSPERVVATGYARTDRLLNPPATREAVRAALGLPAEGRLILFAPTWKQDAAGRSLYPFGCTAQQFLGAIANLARQHAATIVLRSHLNSGEAADFDQVGILALPASRYPDTEAVLLACDLLVCDWSSIAFDWLLLDRPAFFLDAEAPFKKGFSLGPEYRYGPIVRNLQGLLEALQEVLENPEGYWQEHASKQYQIREKVYGLADGHAAERCVQRLQANLEVGPVKSGSSR